MKIHCVFRTLCVLGAACVGSLLSACSHSTRSVNKPDIDPETFVVPFTSKKPLPPIIMVVDRPFAYNILEKKSGEILFTGVVYKL